MSGELCGLSVEDVTVWPPKVLGVCARIADHNTGCLTEHELTVSAMLEDRAQMFELNRRLFQICEDFKVLTQHLAGCLERLASHPATGRLILDLKMPGSPATPTGDPTTIEQD